MAGQDTLRTRVRNLIVRQLRLEMRPEDLADDAQLFGGALGLDSIDALELVVGIEKEFGVSIADQAQGEKALRSVDTIAQFLAERGVSA